MDPTKPDPWAAKSASLSASRRRAHAGPVGVVAPHGDAQLLEVRLHSPHHLALALGAPGAGRVGHLLSGVLLFQERLVCKIDSTAGVCDRRQGVPVWEAL